MQNTKRYLLVPEEIYQSLASPPPSDGTPIGLVRNRIKQIKNDDGINEAERAIKYEQELKRLNKLTRDEDERPVGVKLENLSDVVAAMPKPVNVKRPIVVATRRHLKVGRARKENVEQLEDDDDDDDDVHDHAHETPKPSSSNKRQPTQTEILKLIYKNAQSLGVSEEGQFLYKDLSSPVAFTSVEPLLREAQKSQRKISRTDVQNYLASQRTYTLHRQAKRRYRRLPTLAPGLHTEWQADLAIFDRLAKQNRGYKYLLVCIDTLSRQVFVEPIKIYPVEGVDGSGKGIHCPRSTHFFRAKDVEHFCMLTSPQFHAGMAERANRSIKERLYRYFTERNTYKWIDVVQDIVRAINHSPNSSIEMRPADVNFKNAEALRQKLHNAAENVVRRQPRYRVEDRVRIEKYKHVFQKGYLPRFTNELFTVAEVHSERSPVVYRLRDDHNEIISGTVEQQFVQVEWQTGNTVRIELPPSNVTNPHELGKNLYRLLGEGSDPLAKKVRSTQNSFMLTINKARRWAREEYIKRKTKEKRGVRDEELLLQALLTDTGTVVDLNSVTHGLLAREKRAETSNIALRIPTDDNDSYQQKLDEYFSKLSDKNLSILDELGMTKLNAEIKNLSEEERAILEATKEMGTEAWIQAYREIRLVCQFNYDVNKNRFVLNTDPRYVKKVEVSPQLAYILGFNNTEFMQAENEARFMPDMSGGVSSFHVYTPDLIEPMMIGDVTAPVLRIVTIRGAPDQVIEEQFFAIQYHKILLKEVSEILIEVRTNSGSLMPFQYGTLDWSAFSSDCVQYGGYNIYRGLPYQRGAGVGAVFRSLMRYLLPIGKQIGSAIGRQGIESGNRVLTNVLEGKDLKESLVIPPTNVSVVRSFFRQVLPLATITQESPYLFRLHSDNLWTDLSRIYLYLELSVEKPGANDKNRANICPATKKVTVGNTEVYDSGNLYSFKAYITNELSFPINAKKNFLGSTGYYHTVNQDDSTDEGFKERCKIFKGGKNAQFLSRLDFDLGNQELYLLNNLDLLFTIYKAKDVFLLQTLKANDSTKYRLTVHDVKIYAKMVEVQPSLNMSLYKTLEKQPATYADHFVSAFVDMYEALGMANSERSFDISMAQFKKGWSFFVIPLTSTLDDICGFELLRSGTTNVRATFNSPIPLGGVEMIVLGEFDQMIMVDYNRHIVTDSKLG
ncbi:hypothetical protein niasHS_011557 [Heterodera schachtii]|uniref:Integrase catalytic domain-containing protein n=1 Tax=Heterodera schachtii TaxID=97005 RepID=A0ABD2IKH8_HETSC